MGYSGISLAAHRCAAPLLDLRNQAHTAAHCYRMVHTWLKL